MSDLASQLKEREDMHKAEIQKEQDEVSRLKAELEEMKKNHKAEMEQATAKEKERQEGQAQKHKELLDKAEAYATSAQKELDELKGKAEVWKSELTRINAEMASKFFHSSFLADMIHMPTYLPLFSRELSSFPTCCRECYPQSSTEESRVRPHV